METTEQIESASCTTCVSFIRLNSVCSEHNVVVHRPDKSCTKYEKKEIVEQEETDEASV